VENAVRKIILGVVVSAMTFSSIPNYSAMAGESGARAPLVLEAKIALGPVDGRIDHIALDTKRERLFVAELGNDTVAVASLPDGKIIHVIDGLKEPQGVGYLASNDTLYVASGGDGTVQMYAGADYTFRGRLDLKDDADNIRVDANANKVFVGYGSGAIAVIDSATGQKVGNAALKGHPESFQLSQDGQRIFVNVPTIPARSRSSTEPPASRWHSGTSAIRVTFRWRSTNQSSVFSSPFALRLGSRPTRCRMAPK
jgi:hypothetical protein